jgi:transposase
MTLEQVRRKAVLEALARHRGNKKQTAHEMGVSLKTLYNLLNRWVSEGHVTRDWLDSLAGTRGEATTEATNTATTESTTTDTTDITEGARDDDDGH